MSQITASLHSVELYSEFCVMSCILPLAMTVHMIFFSQKYMLQFWTIKPVY